MTSIQMTAPPLGGAAPKYLRLVALPALALATVLARRMPLRFTLAVVRWIKCLAWRGSATPRLTEAVLAARDWAASVFPGRSACMEASLAAFLLVAMTGRSVDWCVGCRFRPAQSHAWIEIDQQPIGEPNLLDRPFHVTIRI